jgi:hypothetical protein
MAPGLGLARDIRVASARGMRHEAGVVRGRGAQLAGDSKINNDGILEIGVSQNDIRGLEVAVSEAAPVKLFKGLSQCETQAQSLLAA